MRRQSSTECYSQNLKGMCHSAHARVNWRVFIKRQLRNRFVKTENFLLLSFIYTCVFQEFQQNFWYCSFAETQKTGVKKTLTKCFFIYVVYHHSKTDHYFPVITGNCFVNNPFTHEHLLKSFFDHNIILPFASHQPL